LHVVRRFGVCAPAGAESAAAATAAAQKAASPDFIMTISLFDRSMQPIGRTT
jgi:hypothetical protein